MPKAKGVDWVACGPEPYLATCERCGETEPKPEMGIELRRFVALLRALPERLEQAVLFALPRPLRLRDVAPVY